MTYTNERKILIGLRKSFNYKSEIDRETYEIINSYLENPFNINENELEVINDLIEEEQQTRFNVYSLAADKASLSKTLKHIKPCKLNTPIAPIKTMYGKGYKPKVHIPVYTNTKKLKLAA